jgi:2'-5' RNA ligase
MIRTFVAIELPAEVKRVVAGLQDRQIDGVRWIDPEGAHLTLKFLGATPEEAVPRIEAALARAAQGIGPLRLHTAGVGRFPGAVWLAVEGDLARLQTLRDAVEREVSPVGWPTEPRQFTPHVTLGRLKRGRTDDVPIEPPPPIAFEAHEVCLVLSELLPTGARYSRLFAVPL